MQVSHTDSAAPRGVSVWVNDNDSNRAEQRAISALADAGWHYLGTDDISATDAGDYFRACPSQQAFLRAQTEGIAWRFDDDSNGHQEENQGGCQID